MVDGMKFKGKTDNLSCTVMYALKGSLFRLETREPHARAKSVLELVHRDLAGPIGPESIDCHKYAISFTDDYTTAVCVYFLKNKSDV